MHTDEILLFLAVIALALALVIVLVAPKVRAEVGARGRAAAPGPSIDAPPEPPSRLPPVADAMPLVSPSTGTAGAAVDSMVCPTCRRLYAGGVKFCPYDARVLARDIQQSGAPDLETVLALNQGKICPSCARKYDRGAVVCGRDGSALVSVN